MSFPNSADSASSPREARVIAHSTALICQDVDLRGEITIGAGSVIHPKASILATSGPIAIGANCLVEETATLINRSVGMASWGNNRGQR